MWALVAGCSGDDATGAGEPDGSTSPTSSRPVFDDTAPPRTMLVQHNLWRPMDATTDPFDDRPAEVGCDISGYAAEELAGEPVFAVIMRSCDYMTAQQPSLTDVVAGDELKIRFWHFELQSIDPDAEVHAALSFDGDIVWEKTIPIPQDSGGLLSEVVTVDQDYPTGTPIEYHVHNHGLNEYFLIEFSRTDR